MSGLPEYARRVRVGQCATVDGLPGPWRVLEWLAGRKLQLAYLTGWRIKRVEVAAKTVTPITAHCDVCLDCRHRGTVMCGVRVAA